MTLTKKENSGEMYALRIKVLKLVTCKRRDEKGGKEEEFVGWKFHPTCKD